MRPAILTLSICLMATQAQAEHGRKHRDASQSKGQISLDARPSARTPLPEKIVVEASVLAPEPKLETGEKPRPVRVILPSPFSR